MKRVALRAVGVCAPGLADWTQAARVLNGDEPFAPAISQRRAPDGLPPIERRRINETSRLACLAAQDALAQAPAISAATTPTVFASADGDGAVVAQTLAALGQREIAVSPTAFHNSVFNAPAGYWSIATRSTAASTTVCAAEASLAVALLEAFTQVHATGRPVLVVAVDAPFPPPVQALGESKRAFACALLIDAPTSSSARLERWTIAAHTAAGDAHPGAIDGAFAGNAAAHALPLLRAFACGRPALVGLPYADGTSLELWIAP